MKYVLYTLLGIIAFVGVGFLVAGTDFFLYKTFAPKYEEVRRETFENTKSYNQGMIQELQNMQFEYVKADSLHKKALADIILHRTADYDNSKLPSDLYQFVNQLKRERTY